MKIAIHLILDAAPPEGVVRTGGAVKDLQFPDTEKAWAINFYDKGRLKSAGSYLAIAEVAATTKISLTTMSTGM